VGAGPGIGREHARELARRELARSIYQPSVLSRWWNDIVRWLSGLVSPNRTGSPDWLAVLALAVLVAAAIAGAVYWLGPTRANRRIRRQPVSAGRARSAADYRRAADQLADAGDYQAAIIERVRAMMADLGTRQILPSRPARTARELASETGVVFPADAAELAAAARLFDEVRYGGGPGSRPDYERVRDLDNRLAAATPIAVAGSDGPEAGPSGELPGVPLLAGANGPAGRAP
jgi:Domain of unknown function (DUF4129)